MNKAKFDSLPPKAKAAIEKQPRRRAIARVRQDVGRPQRRADRRMEEGSQAHRHRARQGANGGLGQALAPVVSGWEAKDPRNQALLDAMRQDLAASRANK